MLSSCSLRLVQLEVWAVTLVSLDPWRYGYLIHVCTILGGAYDTVPEVCILLALFEGSDHFYPVVFDEAGTKLTLDD